MVKLYYKYTIYTNYVYCNYTKNYVIKDYLKIATLNVVV